MTLTLSPPIPLRLYILPYWSNLPFFNFWHSGALALRTELSGLSKIKNGRLASMALKPLNSCNLDQLALNGLRWSVNSTQLNWPAEWPQHPTTVELSWVGLSRVGPGDVITTLVINPAHGRRPLLSTKPRLHSQPKRSPLHALYCISVPSGFYDHKTEMKAYPYLLASF